VRAMNIIQKLPGTDQGLKWWDVVPLASLLLHRNVLEGIVIFGAMGEGPKGQTFYVVDLWSDDVMCTAEPGMDRDSTFEAMVEQALKIRDEEGY
jgi:hypothetical protein